MTNTVPFVDLASQHAEIAAEVEAGIAAVFAATSFGERRGCLHDTMAVAVAAGSLVPDLAPTVNAEVDTSHGPGRGQTICDLRGMYMGFPAQDGAHCTVVLQAAVDFADQVVALIADAGDAAIDVTPAAAGGPTDPVRS